MPFTPLELALKRRDHLLRVMENNGPEVRRRLNNEDAPRAFDRFCEASKELEVLNEAIAEYNRYVYRLPYGPEEVYKDYTVVD